MRAADDGFNRVGDGPTCRDERILHAFAAHRMPSEMVDGVENESPCRRVRSRLSRIRARVVNMHVAG